MIAILKLIVLGHRGWLTAHILSRIAAKRAAKAAAVKLAEFGAGVTLDETWAHEPAKEGA